MIEPLPASAVSPSPDAPAPPERLRRKTYKIAGPQTWALAREFYLSGMPAPEVARRLDVSEHNLRRKAWKEGWSRRQHAERVLDVVMPKVGGDRSGAPLLVDRGFAAATGCGVEGDGLGSVGAAATGFGSPEPPPEAPPLVAAGMLLRQAAAAALCGRAQAALEGVKLAENLARAARLLSDTEHGVAESRSALLAQAKEALEDDPDYEPDGWRDSAEGKALEDDILRGLKRRRQGLGRKPPQHLPLWVSLSDYTAYRPLAEALCLVVEGQAWVECPDFGAAVEAARAAGRGEEIDAALSTPVPWALCTWLSEEEKAAVAEREARDDGVAREAAARERVSPVVEVVEAAVQPVEDVAASEAADPAMRRLGEGDGPWAQIARRSTGLSDPYAPLT